MISTLYIYLLASFICRHFTLLTENADAKILLGDIGEIAAFSLLPICKYPLHAYCPFTLKMTR